MKTSPDERRTAVRLARRLLDKSEPPMLELGECELLAQVIVDCHEVFLLHAPIIHAAKSLVSPTGTCVREWSAPWTALTTAILKLREHEREGM